MRNTVLWANHAPDGPTGYLRWSSSLSLAHCAVDGGADSVFLESGTLDWGDGNMISNPLFVDPSTGDYRLWCLSPCIDAGDNACVPWDELDLDADGDTTTEKLPFDLMGNPRFVDRLETPDTGNSDPNFPALPLVDLGAYEFQSCARDLDCDGDVDLSDLAELMGQYGTCGEPPADFDGSGCVDLPDLAELLGHYHCGVAP
jgi:hypothetical protein